MKHKPGCILLQWKQNYNKNLIMLVQLIYTIIYHTPLSFYRYLEHTDFWARMAACYCSSFQLSESVSILAMIVYGLLLSDVYMMKSHMLICLLLDTSLYCEELTVSSCKYLAISFSHFIKKEAIETDEKIPEMTITVVYIFN